MIPRQRMYVASVQRSQSNSRQIDSDIKLASNAIALVTAKGDM